MLTIESNNIGLLIYRKWNYAQNIFIKHILLNMTYAALLLNRSGFYQSMKQKCQPVF